MKSKKNVKCGGRGARGKRAYDKRPNYPNPSFFSKFESASESTISFFALFLDGTLSFYW